MLKFLHEPYLAYVSLLRVACNLMQATELMLETALWYEEKHMPVSPLFEALLDKYPKDQVSQVLPLYLQLE